LMAKKFSVGCGKKAKTAAIHRPNMLAIRHAIHAVS
jgi:hypothetical protein